MQKLMSNAFALALLVVPLVADVHQGVPPEPLTGFDRATSPITYSNGVWGRLQFAAGPKSLRCAWTLGDPKNPQSHGEQIIATSYYPTCLITPSPTKWVVAGKTTRGATVIEVWTVQKPLVAYPLNQNASPVIEPATVTQIDVVYDAAVEGRDMVAQMCGKFGDANKILVQFYDSKDLYELDLTSQALTLVASPTAGGGVLQAPALSKDYQQFWTREHLTYGYVYVLASAGSSTGTLVFKDTNKDGSIDSWEAPSSAAWASNYGSAANYVQ